MTDLEITKLCAEAMGYSVVKGDGRYKNRMAIATKDGEPVTNYDPLKHDAQAMALVKKFRISVNSYNDDYQVWPTRIDKKIAGNACTFAADLNRAICECVAKMKAADAV